MLNRAELIGHLGRDPEVRTLQDGAKVANFSMATTEKWTDRQSGEKKEVTEWHRVVVWRGLAGVVEQYLRKGSKVYVSGRLQTRKWQDQNGQDRYTTEIVLSGPKAQLTMLDSKSGGGGPSGPESDPYAGQQYGDHRGESAPTQGGDFGDEIPF